jgi:hypothetical protein
MKKIFLHVFIVMFSSSLYAQNVGIGTTNPTNALHIVSSDDTALFATTTSSTPLTPAIHGYSNSVTSNQIGILGTYNGSGFGAAVVGLGYLGVAPPSSKDIGVYASQHTAVGRALYVDGITQLVDGNQANGLILTSDATGKATWQKPAAGQHAFAVKYSPSTLTVTNSGTGIPFDVEEYDLGNDIAGGVFTAPDTGLYHFDGTVVWSLSSSSSNYFVESYFYITDPTVPIFGNRVPSITIDNQPAVFGGTFTQHFSTDVHLDAGNTVQIYVNHNSSVNERIIGNQGFFGGNYYSRFTGHKLF